MLTALHLPIGGAPAVITFLSVQEATMIHNELMDLFTTRDVDGIVDRLRAIPFIQQVSLGAISDLNRILSDEIRDSPASTNNTFMLAYLESQTRWLSLGSVTPTTVALARSVPEEQLMRMIGDVVNVELSSIAE
jgi:hypothetical protein